jgi:hypothetical protein
MVVSQVLDGLLHDYSDMAIDYMVDYLARNSPDDLTRLQQTIQERMGRAVPCAS